MDNTVDNNLKKWGSEHHWSGDGDEWDGQAKYCNQTYDCWKNELVEALILPNLGENLAVLEIAPGHGRWTKELVKNCAELILVDLSPSCIEFCKKEFSEYNKIQYIVNDGATLPNVTDNSVDFIWSFDSFVHMSKEIIDAYVIEIKRVLKPGGKAIIHHAGRNHMFLFLGFIRNFGYFGEHIYKAISMGKFGDDDGWRSNVSVKVVKDLVQSHGLEVESQLQFWGKNNDYGVPRYGDFVTIIKKPL